jgi:NADH-quinone oxidoreductase subunit A
MNINALFFLEYNSVLMYLLISLIVAFILVIISYLFAKQEGGTEKLSTYECGFEPFEDARNTFDIKFYIIAILFIIFDIEVAFLFPWSVTFNYIGSLGFWVIMDFIVELVIGYVYIWKKGALD